EMPAERQTHRVGTCGPVERLGDGGPPVDHQRLLVCSGDGDAADVESLGPVGPGRVVDIYPSEDQGAVAELQLFEPVEGRSYPDVALGKGLERTPPLPEGVLKHLLRHAPQDGQPLVGCVHMSLFGRNVGMGHKTRNLYFACWPGLMQAVSVFLNP